MTVQLDVESSSRSRNSNIVLVGRKPVMNYVVACITCFNQGFHNITLRARGPAISKAVDTVEILRRAFVQGLKMDEVKIGSEIFEKNGKKFNVSIIEMVLRKPNRPSTVQV